MKTACSRLLAEYVWKSILTCKPNFPSIVCRLSHNYMCNLTKKKLTTRFFSFRLLCVFFFTFCNIENEIEKNRLNVVEWKMSVGLFFYIFFFFFTPYLRHTIYNKMRWRNHVSKRRRFFFLSSSYNISILLFEEHDQVK